jgi:hypothetical protein
MKRIPNLTMHACRYFSICLLFVLALLTTINAQKSGKIIPTDLSQKDFLNAYKMIFDLADKDYRGTSASMDTMLFHRFGEFSIYWSMAAGTDQGSFIIPDADLPSRFSNLTSKSYTGYNWQSVDHRSIQFKDTPKKIAIFRSKIETGGYSVSWEAQYFKNMFETFLFKDMYYFINEDELTGGGLSDSTAMLIIPAFTVNEEGDKYYIDSIFSVTSNIKNSLDNFLSRGGMVYTEGNAAYFLQKAGYAATIDFNDKASASGNLAELNSFSATNPIAFAHNGVADMLYSGSVPKVNTGSAEIIAKLKSDSRPVIFALSGNQANGGRIVCNLGIPTVGGVSEVESGSRQLQWTFNTILYAFSQRIDIARNVVNQLPPKVIAGDNAISFDRIDTFEVHVNIRNVSGEAINGLTLKEDFRNYFIFLDVPTSQGTYAFSNGVLTFSGISLPAHSEKSIVYRLSTTEPDDAVHEKVDKLLDYDNYISASLNKTSYGDSEGNHNYTKRRDYGDIMFSARLVGDADINWKNFLGLHWQPFKVFMNMENKERTEADSTVYTQYIPKDMPFYRSDGKLNIPIIKTPGGTFIDVLHGYDKRIVPPADADKYDMDGDGDPDVWLDTASIYPKGYTITEELVYWANPWKTLQAGTPVYEDINHNGSIDPGDQIRAWKITWPVGVVKGYDYFDPYCSLELWVDAPDMVAMAQGVGYAYGRNDNKDGFYPYKTLDQARTAHSNTDCWTNWMDKNNDGTVQWSKMYHQKMYNYQGYAFMDSTTYQLKPWDVFYGTVPHPHEEFIAVISMGGEEIDMYHPTPSQSLYSKINYKTIFNEKRVTPIRTTYSFYAPLPNPLQFEYLASNYSISDTLGNPLINLPAKGKAKLRFDLDASTEYSYYWIRNVGHKVDRKPSWIQDTVSGLGSGVFGYMIYEIPKGMGGYKITLPKKSDGTYDTDAIVKVDGQPFQKWLTNPNTGNVIEIWEDPFSYQVYIPQLLIPPSLSDKNGDDKDDWIDDLGDRYHSSTGFLHDPFMAGNGEDYPGGAHNDDGNIVTSGWSAGADGEYGSDHFDQLGKAHFTINALYEGKGKEGPVDISKGGTLVVEEIFGGSPWVIFSHVLTANAEGVEYKITSSASPTTVKYGVDTVYIKHEIEDINEPHEFDGNYDPYRASFGSPEATVTSMAGGKDPCDWVDPNNATTTIIDLNKDRKTVKLIPGALKNTELHNAGYPRSVTGAFLEVKIEVMNGSNYDWENATITPVLTGLGNTKAELSYVSYPRPLVPGDQPAIDTTGWRFNQPEGEVLINLGNVFPSKLQSTRRVYFVFLFNIDPSLAKGIHEIGFTLTGTKTNYKGQSGGNLSLNVAPVKFCIVDKGNDGRPTAYTKFKIGQGTLNTLNVNGSEYFQGLKQVKWSGQDVNYTDFNNMTGTLSATFSNGVEVIDLAPVKNLPSADTSKLYLLEKVVVNSYRAGEDIDLTTGENLKYAYAPLGDFDVPGNKIVVSPYGPRILVKQELYSVNGVPVEKGITINPDDSKLYIVTKLSVINVGSDVSQNTVINVNIGPFYNVLTDSLASNLSYSDGLLTASLGLMVPGETKTAYVYYGFNQTITSQEDLLTIIRRSNITYQSTVENARFTYSDTTKVLFKAYDFQLEDIQNKKIGDHEYNITATAVNRGLPASNVWLRIYPVVGGGISEFPIAELKIKNFLAGQTIQLPVDYVTPNNEKIEIYAKIDDGDKIAELIEKNNTKIALLTEATSGVDEAKGSGSVIVAPNPFTDQVRFEYQLTADVKEVTLSIYTQTGSEVVKFINCPTQTGLNTINWTPSQLASGNYIYRLTITGHDGKITKEPGILVKTER